VDISTDSWVLWVTDNNNYGSTVSEFVNTCALTEMVGYTPAGTVKAYKDGSDNYFDLNGVASTLPLYYATQSGWTLYSANNAQFTTHNLNMSLEFLTHEVYRSNAEPLLAGQNTTYENWGARSTGYTFYYPWIAPRDLNLGNLSIYGAYTPMYAQGDNSTTVYNGGYTSDFGAGSGFLFISNKSVYQTREDVLLRWVYNVPFTVTSAKLYSNGTASGSLLLRTFTGSGSTENEEHRYTHQYTRSGQYQPMVRVTGTGAQRDVYLGGAALPNANYKITVIDPIEQLAITGAIVNTFTGSMVNIGLQGGNTSTGTLFNIFNSALGGFGTTGNIFLDTGQSIVLMIPRSAIWVSQKIFSIAQYSALVSFVADVVHPPRGKSYILPSTMFGYTMPAGLAGENFTVSYNQTANSANLDYLVQLIFTMGVFAWAVKHLLFVPHRKG